MLATPGEATIVITAKTSVIIETIFMVDNVNLNPLPNKFFY